ncbi:MAG: hypothetical protein ACJAYC_002099 [Halieaceae bacterium]
MNNERDETLNDDSRDDGLQVDPTDRLTERPEKGGLNPLLILGVMGLIGVIAVLYFMTGKDTEPTPPLPAPTMIEPALPPAPDIPEAQPEPELALPLTDDPEPEPEPEGPPVTLETSDEPVRKELAKAGSSDLLSAALSNTDLIQRGTGLIDGFSRGLVLTKILPLAPPTGKFSTIEQGDQILIDPVSYDRYDANAAAIAALDTEQLVASFHTFRPLLEQAYATLGYPKNDFDNALIRSLDKIISTPEIEGDIAIAKKESVYIFVDAELERLSALQKQLLRMGPDNIALLKQQAMALRAGLLKQ